MPRRPSHPPLQEDQHFSETCTSSRTKSGCSQPGNFTASTSSRAASLNAELAPRYAGLTMIVLAADTSSDFLSVALCELEESSEFPHVIHPAGGVYAESVTYSPRRHSEQLLQSVDDLLRRTRIALSQVDLLAVSTGPGSFTGLRIGVATWKGLALANALPLVGVSTLDVLSRGCVSDASVVTVLLDAKMNEVYGAVYCHHGTHIEKRAQDRVCPLAEILKVAQAAGNDMPESSSLLFIGDGAELYKDEIIAEIAQARFAPSPVDVPRGSAVAYEGVHQRSLGASTDASTVCPVYLRASQAEEAKAKKEASPV